MDKAVGVSFNFTKLLVADLERATRFYKTVFGFQEWQRVAAGIARRPLHEVIFQPLKPGEATLVLLHYDDCGAPAAGEVILGFTTTDIAALFARAVAEGATVLEAPHENVEQRLTVGFLNDPEGHVIEVVQMD